MWPCRWSRASASWLYHAAGEKEGLQRRIWGLLIQWLSVTHWPLGDVVVILIVKSCYGLSSWTRQIALWSMAQNTFDNNSTLVQAHYWARVDLPTPDQSPPWPQCDGLTVWVTLCFQPYSTFFNPMYPMGLSRAPQTLSHRSLIPW